MSAWARIEAATGVAFDLAHLRCFRPTVYEAEGAALETFLSRSAAPGLYARGIRDSNEGTHFLSLLRTSSLFSSILHQNPELAVLLLEPVPSDDGPVHEPREMAEEDGAVRFGARVAREAALGVDAASGYRHAMDRLRYVRQWATALLLWFNRSGNETLRTAAALSAVADALLGAARDAAWAEFARTRGIAGDCPLTVIAFGKLGGRELNLSSDIDLAYVVPDGLDEKMEREMTRFAEMFGRALEEPMGRGFLYRVDLRLRPYGARGSLVSSMRAHEAYYRKYAEDWEVQALLRSRPIFGSMAERWEAMRCEILGNRKWGSAAVEGLVAMRTRTEETAEPNDIKRGAGGIRDVEWVAQIGVLLAGRDSPSLPRDTVGALAALGAAGALEPLEVAQLVEGYTALRDVEHALQARGNQQTHSWPDDPAERRELEILFAPAGDGSLEARLAAGRRDVRAVYAARLLGGDAPAPSRPDAAAITAFLGRFDPAYAAAVAQNEGSAERLATALERAPVILNALRDAEIVEELISGEIVEAGGGEATPQSAEPKGEAPRLRRTHARRWLRFALTGADPWDGGHGGIYEEHPVGIAFQGSGLAVVLLGSLANGTDGPESDADLLILRRDEDDPVRAERAARESLKALDAMRREGAPAAIDLRLRPQGGKGALVHSLASFRRYGVEEMEPWERLALASAFPLTSDSDDLDEATQAALPRLAQRPMGSAEWRALLEIKDRVERERSRGEHDLKLGPGGVMDAEWTIRTAEMRQGADRMSRYGKHFYAPGCSPLQATGESWSADFDVVVLVRRTLLLRGLGDMLPPAVDAREAEEALGEATVARVREAQRAIRAAWLAAREEIEGLC